MNGEHLRAFFWLRWRLLVNQVKRGGVVNAVLLAVLAAAGVGLAILLLIGSFLVGLLALPKASPVVHLLVWDGLVVAFLFFWAIGLVTELQRSEVLSLDKFLHLPVSVSGAFLINYLSSLLSLTLIIFVPALVGLSLGLAFGKGPLMLLLLPLVAALLLMVTAITYQFQSWLASLMTNPRRRRTVIVVVTMAFVLVFQLPNLVNVLRPWRGPQPDEAAVQEQVELQRALASGKITAAQFQARQEEIRRAQQAQALERGQQTWQQVQEVARLVNLVLPPGWLPLGGSGLAEGKVLPALLGTLGLGLLGTASLWRAYRTTLRLYTGQFTGGRRRPAVAAVPAKAGKPSAGLLERDLPWVSEHAAGIALASLRSLLRAPEAKMLLLTPMIMALIFGGLLVSQPVRPPEAVRPLMAFGGIALILFTMLQLVGNQFGFDRHGFRVFVLCPAPRREILLGKNLAAAPLALGLSLAVLIPFQVVCPLRLGDFLATLPQLVSMYLLFCLLANFLSILAPMRMAPGSLKPQGAKLVPMLLQLAFFFLFPPVLSVTLLPLGAAFLVETLAGINGALIGLVLAVAECVVVVFLYQLVVAWQGDLLQRRERKILEVVTPKAE